MVCQTTNKRKSSNIATRILKDNKNKKEKRNKKEKSRIRVNK